MFAQVTLFPQIDSALESFWWWFECTAGCFVGDHIALFTRAYIDWLSIHLGHAVVVALIDSFHNPQHLRVSKTF